MVLVKRVQVTREGFEKLQGELGGLIKQRPEVVTKVAQLREQGDLSENAGYHAAREKLGFVDGRIRELKYILNNCEIIGETDQTKVGINSTVVVDDGSAKSEYTIVGQLEAEPASGKLSTLSPIGAGLMGKKVGDLIEVVTPVGKIKLKIMAIKA